MNVSLPEQCRRSGSCVVERCPLRAYTPAASAFVVSSLTPPSSRSPFPTHLTIISLFYSFIVPIQIVKSVLPTGTAHDWPLIEPGCIITHVDGQESIGDFDALTATLMYSELPMKIRFLNPFAAPGECCFTSCCLSYADCPHAVYLLAEHWQSRVRLPVVLSHQPFRLCGLLQQDSVHLALLLYYPRVLKALHVHQHQLWSLLEVSVSNWLAVGQRTNTPLQVRSIHFCNLFVPVCFAFWILSC